MSENCKRPMVYEQSEFRDNWRFNYVGADTWKLDQGHHTNPEDEWIAKIDGEVEEQEKIDVHAVLAQLPERYKSLLWKYYWEGKTMKQIGDERGVSKAYIWQELQVAKTMFKQRV